MKQPRILIVDDKRDTALELKEYLELNDFEVTVAFSGGQALNALIENKFDLMLTDYRLPDYTGFDLVQQCQKHRKFPVVYLTGMSRSSLDPRIKEGKACKVIEKGVPPRKIVSTIEEMI